MSKVNFVFLNLRSCFDLQYQISSSGNLIEYLINLNNFKNINRPILFIIIISCGDGVQCLKLRWTFWFFIGQTQKHHTLKPIARESPHSNQCTELDIFRLYPFGQLLEPLQCFMRNKETVLPLHPMTYKFIYNPTFFDIPHTRLDISLTFLLLARCLHK